MTHVTSRFDTRAAAELATEHLVQQYGLERANISLQPIDQENSVGTTTSGGDEKTGSPTTERRTDGALNGAIELSVDIDEAQAQRICDALKQAGATNLLSA